MKPGFQRSKASIKARGLILFWILFLAAMMILVIVKLVFLIEWWSK